MSHRKTVIRIKRPEFVAIVISLVVHMFALYLLSLEDLLGQNQPPPELVQQMSVHLVPLPGKATPKPSPPPAEPRPAVRPAPPQRKPPPPVWPEKVSPVATPDIFAVAKPEAPAVQPPAASQPKESPPPAPPPLDPGQFPDMISYLEAVRQRRRAAGEIPQQSSEPPSARSIQEAEDVARMARVQRNLQQSGTNGIFHISSLDARSATFSFRGWKGEYSYSRREEYQVEAGFNQDIQRIVVRKMIEIIRRYHDGDFNWESPRLERIVVLSARLQDNDGLEDFLMREFFGPQ